jgi:hypothetical protein
MGRRERYTSARLAALTETPKFTHTPPYNALTLSSHSSRRQKQKTNHAKNT